MGTETAIEWCRHTFNPWVGCTRLSPACEHCFAEAWSRRTGQSHLWDGDRRRTSAANWQQPLKWNRAAEAAGRRDRVFCGSLMDFADNQVPGRWRDDAWHRIDQCRALDWMILSKRPENYSKMLPDEPTGTPAWGEGWPHVWLGTTVEDRARLRRIDVLRRVPARIRFLSIEPLLEDLGEIDLRGIHLVIVGGESGPGARPMHPEWVRSAMRQCAAAGVAFFFKQWGEWLPALERDDGGRGYLAPDDGGDEDRLGDVRSAPLRRFPDQTMWRVGKKRAGRLLDGRTHDAMPA